MTATCPADRIRQALLSEAQSTVSALQDETTRISPALTLPARFAYFLENDCGLRLADEPPRPNEWLERNENEKREVYQW